MLPIPKNLREILVPKGGKNDEFKVYGELKCTCGTDDFEIYYVADIIDGIIKVAEIDDKFFLIIKGICKKCGTEYELFDNDFNGWNGFVCEGFGNRITPRPKAKKWSCLKCNNFGHKIKITIYSTGKQDFIEDTEGEFDENDWVEAYSWIVVEIECSICGLKDEKWISYETM